MHNKLEVSDAMTEVNLLADYQSEHPVGADAVTTTIADLSKKRVVVALGMHRSGTSLLTGLLGELGVELGDKFLPLTRTMNRAIGNTARSTAFKTAFWIDCGKTGMGKRG